MGHKEQTEVRDMQRSRIPTGSEQIPRIDELPVFSFQYYTRAMRFYWAIGFVCGMGIGLAQVRLWPRYAPEFVILQGILLSFALFHVLRVHNDMKKKRAEMKDAAEQLLALMKAELQEKFPDQPEENARQMAQMRKTMGI
jgi:hypothetical protein